MERPLNLTPIQPGIASLHRAEQTFLSGEQQAPAIHVDAATLEYQTRLPFAHFQPKRQLRRDGIIVRPVVVFGPAVELPVGDGQFTLPVANEYGAIVPRPNPVGGINEKLDGVKLRTGLLKNTPGAVFLIVVVNQNTNALDPCELAYDVGVNPRDRCESARPILVIVWPGDPGGLMRFPLGGHAEAQ